MSEYYTKVNYQFNLFKTDCNSVFVVFAVRLLIVYCIERKSQSLDIIQQQKRSSLPEFYVNVGRSILEKFRFTGKPIYSPMSSDKIVLGIVN